MRWEFDPCVKKTPGGVNGHPLQYSCLKKKLHGQRTLVGYSPCSCRVWHDWTTEHTDYLGRSYHVWGMWFSLITSIHVFLRVSCELLQFCLFALLLCVCLKSPFRCCWIERWFSEDTSSFYAYGCIKIVSHFPEAVSNKCVFKPEI